MTGPKWYGRRSVLRAGAGLGLGCLTLTAGRAHATTPVGMQLGFLPGGNQLGEIAAKHLGYFEAEGLNLVIGPGGPSMDGIAIVASGRADVGQISSSPSLMLAVSQGLPIRAFVVGMQQHPFTFFSMVERPVKTAADFAGKRIGIPATSKILLNALLGKAGIPESAVKVVIIGSDPMPLLTGQVDVAGGWSTNASWIKGLAGKAIGVRLWDMGVQLYGHPYYATQATLEKKPEIVAKFVRAASKGWAFAQANPEAAVGYLVKEYPNLSPEGELEGARLTFTFMFNAATKALGWGTFEPSQWQAQIDLFDRLHQFSAAKPALDNVITTRILEATADARPRIG